MMSGELSKELEYSQQMVQPLLQTLQKLVGQLEGSGGEQSAARQLLESTRHLLRVFFSLNSPGLTEVSLWGPMCTYLELQVFMCVCTSFH